jgi:hypothetical protein
MAGKRRGPKPSPLWEKAASMVPPGPYRETHKAILAIYQRLRAEQRKENGLCANCGKAEPAAGTFSCAACLSRYKAKDKRRAAHMKACPELREEVNAKKQQAVQARYARDPEARERMLVRALAHGRDPEVRTRAYERRKVRRLIDAAFQEAEREQWRSYRARNPDAVRIKWRVKHAKRRGWAQRWEGVTQSDWDRLVTVFGNRCAYCRREGVKLTTDHCTPLCRGGPHTAQNIVPCCARCNARKGTRTSVEWVALLRKVCRVM